MFRKAVNRRTARNPPGPSTGNLIGASKASPTLASGAVEATKDCLPFRKAERLRAALGVDAGVAKTCPGLCASDATDPAQRPTELLPALLEHRLDEAEERTEIVHVHGWTFPHLHDHQRR